jgi:hypothetical protein
MTCPLNTQKTPCFGFCVYVRPLLIGRTMFDGDFLPINFVLNEKLLHLDMLSGIEQAWVGRKLLNVTF